MLRTAIATLFVLGAATASAATVTAAKPAADQKQGTELQTVLVKGATRGAGAGKQGVGIVIPTK